MPQFRSIPDDFAEVALRLERSTGRIQGHYGAGQATVTRWMREAGIPMRGDNKRLIPADFTEVAPTMCVNALAKHYRADDKTIKRWLSQTGICAAQGNQGGRRGTPPPLDFAEIAPTLGLVALSKHYGISHKTIKRWMNETGVKAKPHVPHERSQPKRKFNRVVRIRPGDFQISRTRVTTIYEDAANVLRAYTAVYRCNERGGFDVKGKFWRAGNIILTPDELLERAARKQAA